VRPDWGDWHVAHVPLVHLSDIHWDHIAGGSTRAPDGPILYGFTSCDAIIAGEIPHVNLGGPHPHSLRVCILPEDNDRHVFERLVLEAGPPPRHHDSNEL
jgi:hypothetical protein